MDCLHPDWSKVDWGTAPAWVTAFIALLALFAASASAIFNYRGNKYQQKQLDRIEEDKRKEQASKVAAWIHRERPQVERDGRGDPVVTWSHSAIRVANNSDVPVYGLYAWVHPASDETQIGRAGLERIFAPGTRDLTIDLPQPLTKYAWVSIVFEDSHGLRWHRDGFGELHEITENESAILLDGLDIAY